MIGRLSDGDIAFAVVNDMDVLRECAQLRRIEVAVPSGLVSYPEPPVRRTGIKKEFGPVPAFGAQTETVRREFLTTTGR